MQDPRLTHRDAITTAPTKGINVISDQGEGLDIYIITWSVLLTLLAAGTKLDDLAAPDDNTDLDASAAKHGLMPKAAWSKLNAIEALADVTDTANVGSAIAGGAAKATPVDDDRLGLIDSQAANALKTVTLEVVKAFVAASPALTGTPTVPTAAAGTNTTQAASTAYVRGEIAALLASAPPTLDTLNELATALGNDPNFATTITNLIATKVAATRYVNTSGLATGGGTLEADRNINVPPASQAEAEAGTNNTKVMTPLRVAQAVAALGGGGGGPNLSGVVWIDATTGNNTTGDGSAGKPYATLQKAYDEHYAGGVRKFVINGAVGDLNAGDLDIQLITFGRSSTYVGTITAAASNTGGLRGIGRDLVVVGYLFVQPPAASAGADGASPGEGGYSGTDGTAAPNFELVGLTVTNDITLTGGTGGNGGTGAAGSPENAGANGGNGGNGGSGGFLTLRDCHVGGIIQSVPGTPGIGGNGGNGGESNSGGNGGNGGNAASPGSVLLINTECDTLAEAPSGPGGIGGAGGGGMGSGTDGSSQSGGTWGDVTLRYSTVAVPPPTANLTAVFSVVAGTPHVSYP